MMRFFHIFAFSSLVLALVFPAEVAFAAVAEVTNAEKLSLPADTDVGTVVRITDAITVSGAGTEEANGIYTERGTSSGKPYYNLLGQPDNGDYVVIWSDDLWIIYGFDQEGLYQSSEDVDFPWEVTTWVDYDIEVGHGSVPTITQYAYQSLAAPSDEVTAVFVSGAGTAEANGIYTERGEVNGRGIFTLLGQPDGTDTYLYSLFWNGSGWSLLGSIEDSLYSSQDDVLHPWDITVWNQGEGESPVPTANSAVTRGELDAGATVDGAGSGEANGAYVVSGLTSVGRVSYRPAFVYDEDEIVPVVTYSGTEWHVRDNNDSAWDYLSESEAAFPFEENFDTIQYGDSPAPVVSRSDVASEANWVQAGEPEEEVVVAEPEEERSSGGSSGSSRKKVVRKSIAPSVPGLPAADTGTSTDLPAGVPDPDATSVQIAAALASNPRDLEQDATGEDVRLLQRFLNARGFAVNVSGQPGSAGYETNFFGPLTRAALARFQAASGISPAAGYFGPVTRAFIGTLAI